MGSDNGLVDLSGTDLEDLVTAAIKQKALRPIPESPGDGLNKSEIETLLKSATETGKFDMREKVGCLWARELKQSSKLKADARSRCWS